GGQPRLNDPASFLHYVFGDEAPGSVVLFALPGEQSVWCDPHDTTALHRAINRYRESHNLYFSMSLQDQALAIEEWKRRHPQGDGAMATRGYATTALAIPGVWTDCDVQGPAHRAKNLPATKDIVLRFLNNKFPLRPTIVWDTGYGLQALWLFREL